MSNQRRKVYRLTVQEVQFEELKKGDLFVLEHPSDYENGRKVNLALSDAGPELAVECEEIGGFSRPLSLVREQPSPSDPFAIRHTDDASSV